tara:strand:+ start:614 stop:799 length:186 start_codon:yes stop_codon:yes gene_type:complete
MKLTKELSDFMDAVPRPDKYTNPDQTQALIDHYGMSKEDADELYRQWIKIVFDRIPFTKAK